MMDKKDPIAALLKESKLETSATFTMQTLDKFDEKMYRRMRRRLYLLIASVGVFVLWTVFLLISSDFKVKTFGLMVQLPKVLMMLVISLISYFAIFHLLLLASLGRGRQTNIS